MLNPILYLAVFTLVFTKVLPNQIPDFPIYLLSGLLAWNLFGTSLSFATRSVVDNGNLVNKVYFPREVLPLSSMGIPIVDFTFQAVVLAAFMVILRHSFWGVSLLLLPLALSALLAFTASLVLFVSAINVRYRDTQHLVTVALLMWFWLTPVVYPSGFLVRGEVAGKHLFGISFYHLLLANPMADIVIGFQRALYGVVMPTGTDHPILLPVGLPWLAGVLSLVLVGSLGLLMLAWRGFFHRSGDFAEEL